MKTVITLLLCTATSGAAIIFPARIHVRRLDTCDDEAAEVESQITTCDPAKSEEKFECECTDRGFATDELTCKPACETCIAESKTCHRNRALYYYTALVGVTRIKQCIEYTVGNKDTVCLSQALGVSDSCSLSLGDEFCDRCGLVRRPNSPCTSLCWELDCSNFPGGGVYNTCDAEIETDPDSPFFEFFYANFNDSVEFVCPDDPPFIFPTVSPPTPPPAPPTSDETGPPSRPTNTGSCGGNVPPLQDRYTTCRPDDKFLCSCSSSSLVTDEVSCEGECETCFEESKTCTKNTYINDFKANLNPFDTDPPGAFLKQTEHCIEYTLGDKEKVCLVHSFFDDDGAPSSYCYMMLGESHASGAASNNCTCKATELAEARQEGGGDSCSSFCWELDCTGLGGGMYNTCTGTIETDPGSPFFEFFQVDLNIASNTICPGDPPVSFPTVSPGSSPPLPTKEVDSSPPPTMEPPPTSVGASFFKKVWMILSWSLLLQ